MFAAKFIRWIWDKPVSNEVIDVQRGFHSSKEKPLRWLAYLDDANNLQIRFWCMCNVEFVVQPPPSGVFKWKHCVHAEMKLVDYEKLLNGSRTRKKNTR
jgi:hypothetical protein